MGVQGRQTSAEVIHGVTVTEIKSARDDLGPNTGGITGKCQLLRTGSPSTAIPLIH